MSEAAAVLEFLRERCEALRQIAGHPGPSESDRLLEIGEDVRKLAEADWPSDEVLARVSVLFDRVASVRDVADGYGERHEICAWLSFLGWRHSAGLNLLFESQQWLRVADALAGEPFTVRECLGSFLRLEPDEKTEELFHRFFARPEDLFLALAIIRRKRHTDCAWAMSSALQIRRSLESDKSDGLPNDVRQYFLGESAYLAVTAGRTLGMRSETADLLEAARDAFSKLPAAAPSLARLELCRAWLERDQKNYAAARQRVAELPSQFHWWGMHRDWLLARLLEGLCIKEGQGYEESFERFEELERDARSADPAMYSCVLSNLAHLHTFRGELDQSEALLHTSLAVATSSQIPLMVSLALCSLGELEFKRGRWKLASKLFSSAADINQMCGSETFAAYYRVMAAEALIEDSQFEIAKAQLLLALPTIQREKMVPEGIHALKLLGIVAANCLDAKVDETVREILRLED